MYRVICFNWEGDCSIVISKRGDIKSTENRGERKKDQVGCDKASWDETGVASRSNDSSIRAYYFLH